ncbi:hypothetical protein [Glaciihabitans sp. UYNi722]|uniref:hypothetical protein n=1 Tax=Glaciihabitans sp. UYNi722 TaxID=3156344 RepID=UPI003390E73B
MRWAERLVAVIAGLILVGTIVACYIAATSPNSYSGDGSDIPLSFYLTQVVYGLAPQFAWVGLGAGAGLLFLRGLRWHPLAETDPEG